MMKLVLFFVVIVLMIVGVYIVETNDITDDKNLLYINVLSIVISFGVHGPILWEMVKRASSHKAENRLLALVEFLTPLVLFTLAVAFLEPIVLQGEPPLGAVFFFAIVPALFAFALSFRLRPLFDARVEVKEESDSEKDGPNASSGNPTSF